MATNSTERVQSNWRQNRGAWFTQDDFSQHFQQKKAAIEKILGPLSDVRHALIPYSAGRPLDLYRFERALPGTGTGWFPRTWDTCAPPAAGTIRK